MDKIKSKKLGISDEYLSPCWLWHRRKNCTTPGFNTLDWNELRLDIDESVDPGIVGTMLDMSAVADASVDAVFSNHNIEHLYPHEMPMALAEFKRVLRTTALSLLPAQICSQLHPDCRRQTD